MKPFTTSFAALAGLLGYAAAQGSWPYGPFKTSGRWIVNANDERVTLAGTNWPGHGEVMIPEGLQFRSIEEIVTEIKSLGMNAIRLTFATELVDQIYANNGEDLDIKTAFEEGLHGDNGTIVLQQVLENNPSFTPETKRLEVYDAIAAECERQQIYINLDNHISKAKWCCGGTDGNTWWGDREFDADNWARGNAYMAAHGRNWPAMVSLSLRNEPREPTDNPTLRDESYNWRDWYDYVRAGADAVNEANPDTLIILSGLDYDTYINPVFEGTTLQPGSEVFSRSDFGGEGGYGQDKLVLEIHNYENQIGSCDSLRFNLFRKGFAAMDESNESTVDVFPVMLTEFGHSMEGDAYVRARTYMSCLSEYLPEIKASWFIWVVVGRYYTRQDVDGFDDAWGLMNPDWSAWRNPAYIEEYLKPQVAGTLS